LKEAAGDPELAKEKALEMAKRGALADRLTAVEALKKIGGTRAIEALEKALSEDSEESVREAVAAAFGEVEEPKDRRSREKAVQEVVEVVARYLGIDGAVRQSDRKRIEKNAEVIVLDLILKPDKLDEIFNSNPALQPVRSEIFTKANTVRSAHFGKETLVLLLEKQLGIDRAPSEREKTKIHKNAEAIAERLLDTPEKTESVFRESPALQPFRTQVLERVRRIRAEAADREIVDILGQRISEEKSASVRKALKETLLALGVDPKQVALFYSAILGNPDLDTQMGPDAAKEMRLEAIAELAKSGMKPAAEILRQTAKETHAGTTLVRAVVQALGDLKDHGAVDEIAKKRSDAASSEEDRIAAVVALTKIGGETAIKELVRAMADSSPKVRRLAAKSLKVYFKNTPIGLVTNIRNFVLVSDKEEVRVDGLKSLESIAMSHGAVKPQVLKILEGILNWPVTPAKRVDPSALVRRTARDVYLKVGGTPRQLVLFHLGWLRFLPVGRGDSELKIEVLELLTQYGLAGTRADLTWATRYLERDEDPAVRLKLMDTVGTVGLPSSDATQIVSLIGWLDRVSKTDAEPNPNKEKAGDVFRKFTRELSEKAGRGNRTAIFAVRKWGEMQGPAQPRSEVRAGAAPTGLGQALSVTEAFRRELKLQGLNEIALAKSGARGVEEVLTARIDQLLAEVGTASIQGAIIREVKPGQFNVDSVYETLAKLPLDSELVLFVDPRRSEAEALTAQIEHVKKAIGDTRIRLAAEFDPNATTLEEVVRSVALDRGLRDLREVVVQVRVDKISNSVAPKLVKQALLAAAERSSGRILVETERPLGLAAQELNLFQIIWETLEAEAAGERKAEVSA
jgi:HEAT repeat protein